MPFGGLQGQSTKKFNEDGRVTFDFTSSMSATETISAQSVAATVYSGTDPNPQNIIGGAATASGKVVTQLIVGNIAGVVGVIYKLLCTIDTSLGQRLQQSSYLAIVPDLT